MELSSADRGRLKEARKAIGYSPATASQELVLELPRSERVSAKKLERIENGTTKQMSPILLAALAKIYGKTISDIAPDFVAESKTLSDLLLLTSCWNTKLPFAPDFGIGRVA